MSNSQVKYSIVIPMYNEEENILELHRRLSAVMEKTEEKYEIIFVDDGSTDNSFEKLIELNKSNPKIKIISLSKNFGRQIALTAGIDHACGDIVIMMDSDLQHPPELIPTLVQKCKEASRPV